MRNQRFFFSLFFKQKFPPFQNLLRTLKNRAEKAACRQHSNQSNIRITKWSDRKHAWSLSINHYISSFFHHAIKLSPCVTVFTTTTVIKPFLLETCGRITGKQDESRKNQLIPFRPTMIRIRFPHETFKSIEMTERARKRQQPIRINGCTETDPWIEGRCRIEDPEDPPPPAGDSPPSPPFDPPLISNRHERFPFSLGP